jgi:CyaY protein
VSGDEAGASGGAALDAMSAPFWPQAEINRHAAARVGIRARPVIATTLVARSAIHRILSTVSSPPLVFEDLTDVEYDRRSRAALAAVEAAADRFLQDDVIDIDSSRTGGLLELAFPNGSKIVLNTQPPLHELWLAAQSGGHHFRASAGRWIDRDGREFFAVLSECATAQGGRPLRFEP